MITDRENMASIEQAVTATAVSTDSIYVGGRRLGRGHPMRAFAQVAADVTAAGAATVNVEVIEANDGALTSGVNVIGSSGAKSKDDLVDGFRVLDIPLPGSTKDYIGFRYTVGTGPLTAGTFTAGIVETTESDPRVTTRPEYWTGL